jgi:hypothetical protein
MHTYIVAFAIFASIVVTVVWLKRLQEQDGNT